MSSSRIILPRLAQFGEPGAVPELAVKIKGHQHAAGKIITRGLSRGARKCGESASKLHIAGQESDLPEEGLELGLDLALSGIQDKSVHLPVLDNGTFHSQEKSPDMRGSKTPIPGVGHWTKRGEKLRPPSVHPEMYLSEDDTPSSSKQDLTLTIEGQADPRLLSQRSAIKVWKQNKSNDSGALLTPPTTPDQTHEYEEMLRSVEDDIRQILLCQSFGIRIEKHKSAHGIVATPIFHCPRCFKHWSIYGMSLQNCNNPKQPTKGPEFQLNKKNHYLFQKFTQLPSKDKEHIIDVIKSSSTRNLSLEADISTESLLILSEDDDNDNVDMFTGSKQDLGSTLIARRASIEVKPQNEQRSSHRLTELKPQRSIHKQKDNINQKHSDERNMNKHTQAKTNTHHLKHGGEKKTKTVKNLKVSEVNQNDQLDTVYDDWSNLNGGHFIKEQKQSYKHDTTRDRLTEGESGKYKAVGKFEFGSDTSNHTSIGLVGPDGGYYLGTYDNDCQFVPHSRLNPDGSTCPMTRGPDNLYYPQEDYLDSQNTAEKAKSGLSFTIDHHLIRATPDMQSVFITSKEEGATNFQKFSVLPRNLTWDHEGHSEYVAPTTSAPPGPDEGNAATNYNLNHHSEQEENNPRRKHSGQERDQQSPETTTIMDDDESVSGESEKNIQEEEKLQRSQEKVQEGGKNERTGMENANMQNLDDAPESSRREKLTHNRLDINMKSDKIFNETSAKMGQKDLRSSQHTLDNDRTETEDYLMLPSSLGQMNKHKQTESQNNVNKESLGAGHHKESKVSNVFLENKVPAHCAHNNAGVDQQSTGPTNHSSEISLVVIDDETETVEGDDANDTSTQNLNKETKASNIETETISAIKTETTRIRRSSIMPQVGSQDILPVGSDSYYDVYASSKQDQKGPHQKNGKAQRRASIDHRGKVKNPAVRNVTGRPDTKAGALKKHMLATPKSLLTQNTSFGASHEKAKSSKDLSEMETVEESNLMKSDDLKLEEVGEDEDIRTGDEVGDIMQNESMRREDSAKSLLQESEEQPSKQKTKMRRPPKKEKLLAMRERKRVENQKTEQVKENTDDTITKGYPPIEHQNELPEIVRTPHEKVDSATVNKKESLPQISTPLNKKESSSRIKSANESLEKLSLSKLSKLKVSLNQSVGLDQQILDNNQASFRMTYSTLPGTFDARKRSSKSLLRERKPSSEELPSLPSVKKEPTSKFPDQLGSWMDNDLDYMVIPKASSKKETSSERSPSSSKESEEEEPIWESVSEMWQKHSKEMRRFSTLEEYSYLPLTKAFTFSFFEVPYQYTEQIRELKIRGSKINSMKRPPRMRIKGKKKRPPTAELNRLLEEKRNQAKKQNLVYKLWQMERRNMYNQPIPKLGSF